VNDVGEMLLRNPELLRNLRIQMRPRRMGVAAAITAIFSLIILPALWSNTGSASKSGYFVTVLVFQSLALLIGGGVACLQSVSREKELNTFDYQRITRLSPLELAMGKLLGAPAMAYFVAACMIPAALLGLQNSGWGIGDLIDSWILLIFGTLAFHAFTLMMSMVLRKSLSTGAVLVLLMVAGVPGMSWFSVFMMRGTPGAASSAHSLNFYGIPMPMTPFLSFVYASFAAWFILALERNIKRDPAMYELLTVRQALGFAAWQNFIFIGLYPMNGYTGGLLQTSSMWVNTTTFYALALVLLRNRDRARRRLRELGEAGLSWMEAFWPAPYIFAGVIVTGFFPLLVAANQPRPAVNQWNIHPEPFDISLFLFRLVFFGLWICRDALYLQWMNLRRGNKPLVRAMLYAFVYYTALFVLFFTHNPVSVQPGEAAFQSIFVPVRVLLLDTASWNQAAGIWFIAMVSQAVVMYFFAFLHRQELQSLAARPRSSAVSFPPAIQPGSPAAAR
jgi:hypothetical protein